LAETLQLRLVRLRVRQELGVEAGELAPDLLKDLLIPPSDRIAGALNRRAQVQRLPCRGPNLVRLTCRARRPELTRQVVAAAPRAGQLIQHPLQRAAQILLADRLPGLL